MRLYFLYFRKLELKPIIGAGATDIRYLRGVSPKFCLVHFEWTAHVCNKVLMTQIIKPAFLLHVFPLLLYTFLETYFNETIRYYTLQYSCDRQSASLHLVWNVH